MRCEFNWPRLVGAQEITLGAGPIRVNDTLSNGAGGRGAKAQRGQREINQKYEYRISEYETHPSPSEAGSFVALAKKDSEGGSLQAVSQLCYSPPIILIIS